MRIGSGGNTTSGKQPRFQLLVDFVITMSASELFRSDNQTLKIVCQCENSSIFSGLVTDFCVTWRGFCDDAAKHSGACSNR